MSDLYPGGPSVLADACQHRDCLPGDQPAVLPYHVAPQPGNPAGMIAWYRCPRGHAEWWCGFDRAAAGWPEGWPQARGAVA